MKRIIDKRKKEKFMMDDDYLNGQAKLCGWQGTIVYNSLCRHANINQESFPSIKLMAKQHRVGRNTILKGVENLEKRNVIQVKKMRTKGGQWLNNTYILLDKSDWDYSSQVPVEDTVNILSQVLVGTPPSPCGDTSQVPVEDTKETHIKETHIKETHLATDIAKVIELFGLVNPTVYSLYRNKTQRAACERLLKKWSIPQIKAVVNLLPEINADKYSKGKSITPYELEKNLGYIQAWITTKNSNSKVAKI